MVASGANLHFVLNFPRRIILHHFWWAWLVVAAMVIVFYWQIAVQSGSLWRAITMWVVMYLVSWLGFKLRFFQVLGWTLLLTLMFNFQFIESVGFWLSLLAIGGVYFQTFVKNSPEEDWKLFFPQRSKILKSIQKSLWGGTLVWCFVQPVLWLKWRSWQPIGILSTWLISPFLEPYQWIFLFKSVFLRFPGGKSVEWLFSQVLIWILKTIQFILQGLEYWSNAKGMSWLLLNLVLGAWWMWFVTLNLWQSVHTYREHQRWRVRLDV